MRRLLALCLAASTASAQTARPVEEGASRGYELALSGALSTERGHAVRLFGIGYEVEGLANASARAGLEIEAALTARRDQRRVRVSSAQARTGEDGRFELSIDLPDRALSAPELELRVHRPNEPGRIFSFPLAALEAEAIDLLTDRHRYEPGERVRVWSRVRSVRSQAPIAGREVALALLDEAGNELATSTSASSAAGVVTAELAIPATATAGEYRVRAVAGDVRTEAAIQIWARTVERLLAEIELTGADADGVTLVAPGGPLRGRVIARTPSGTPIRAARVELRVRYDAQPLELTTDDEGRAPFDVRAPAFLSGDVGSETMSARVIHPAHGAVTATATYLMARASALASASARGGALVPELPGTIFVSVSDPRGRPVRSGTGVAVRGAGIRDGLFEGALDARGFVEVPITLPRGAASRMAQGPCAGHVATSVEVEIRIDPPVFARVCARVSPDAEVVPRVAGAPIIAPGSTIEVELARRTPQPVLLEALWNGRAVAFALSRERTARIGLPADLIGTVVLRARALRPSTSSAPSDERGVNGFSIGALDAILVRPADAFRLDVRPRAPSYLVRERAIVELSGASGQTWGALLVRDEAAHGGEGRWELSFLREELHEAAWQPASEANARLIRAALAADLIPEPEPPAPPPLEEPYWRPALGGSYSESAEVARGVLRDPIALRQELLRRGIGAIEQALEREVDSRSSAADRAQIIAGGRFHPDAIERLGWRIDPSARRTLGGQEMTIAMLEAADPGFTFDAVARRVTRRRLARLLIALARLTDPDQPSAERASAQLPPDRWLATLVQIAMVPATELLDAWGRPFVFREVARPRIVVSDRALRYELASPGPDGRIGTGDDVNDPFARAVAEGTTYAVASGEEALLRRFSALSPGTTVLTRMSGAYDRLSLAAREERSEGPVVAAQSEAPDETITFDFDDDVGQGALARPDGEAFRVRGGGRGPGAPPRNVRAQPELPELRREIEAQQRAQLTSEESGGGREQAIAALIREDFPATLFFAGEVAFEGGRAEIEVPLADALTTYRLEAIAWTASGWTTSAMGRVRVDQRALIDAPVPAYATAGDRVRLPVRVENRTDQPLPAEIRVQAEGDLAIEVPNVTIEVPPHEAREAIVELALDRPGDGSLVIEARRPRGEGLDAVRRPLRVLPDARTARERRLELIDGESTIELEIPAEASARGPAQLTLSIGRGMFGESPGDAFLEAWALAMAGEPLPERIVAAIAPALTYEDDYAAPADPRDTALALGALWTERERLTDEDARRALRVLGERLPNDDRLEFMRDDVAARLLNLAPVAEHLDARPAVRADAERLIARVRRLLSSMAARASHAPDLWVASAAALALGGDRARAAELLRRAERHVIRTGDVAWVEPETPFGEEPRAIPTGHAALAYVALGDRAAALPFVRALADMHGDAPLSDVAHAYASAAAARLANARGSIDARVVLDGRAIAVRREGAVSVAQLPLSPGAHRVRISLPRSAVALARLEVAYGLPWDMPPRRRAPIDVTIDGALGARDARAALVCTVRNRGARILARPIVEIELPAGAELDEPARARLRAQLRGDARQEGRTLVLPLRTMAPGGWIRLPLPVRWSTGGTLRGLGAIAYDDVGPEHAPILPVAVLASRASEIEDRGAEPEPPEPESSPPPLPILPPMPLLPRLTPR